MNIVQLVMGLAMLCAGRTFFWVFVGAIGFLAGFDFGTMFITHQPEWVVLAIAITCGLCGIFAAWLFQSMAVMFAGALAGGMIAIHIVTAYMPDVLINSYWISYGCGAIVGVLLVVISFDWAIIFISSLMGAHVLITYLPFEGYIRQMTTVLIVFIGMTLQAMQLGFVKSDNS